MSDVVFLPGDCRESLSWLVPKRSIQTCVTSPPYFGLRDYGHDGQIGQEDTPDAYVAQLVDVFRSVRDVLADDGTLWLNLGDSYAGSGRGGHVGEGASTLQGGTDNEQAGRRARAQPAEGGAIGRAWVPPPAGFKQKDLIGIPWRVAFALQADGWYLRQDIIWHKPNPMPESVTDRCTKAHEYIFLLSKNRKYYFDSEAMKEPAVGGTPGNKKPTKGGRAYEEGKTEHRTSANLHNIGPVEMRNRRSVWTVTTKPYKGAHFATFPPDLIEPCVLAGSRPGDTVLDPFGGSGTTGMVALRHGRKAVLCELNSDYIALAKARCGIATEEYDDAA